MDAFGNCLLVLAKDCDFADVTAVEYKKKSVLQRFVSGLEDPYIRQRIVERDVDLDGALELAEISKRVKTYANCYESEKDRTTVAAINKIDSKYDLVPEAAVNNGVNIDQIAAVSRTF